MIHIKNLKKIIDSVFITMPFQYLDRYMPLIRKHRFNLEVVLDYESLDRYSPDDFFMKSEILKKLGITMTVHAPFNEIFLGAPDPLIREASVQRMDGAFALIQYFSPVSVVIHLNYAMRRFGFIYDRWSSNIIPNLKRYADKCRVMRCMLAIENVYEETPDTIAEVLDLLDGYPVGHCMDVGHVTAFSQTDLKSWLERMGEYISHFHLHDNDFTGDSHHPIGTGKIDFDLIRDFIAERKKKPFITLEPHNENDLWLTLKGFDDKGLLNAMLGK